MAQKLAIALVALFGFVNAGIVGEAPSLAVSNIIEERPEPSRARTVLVKEHHVIVPQVKTVVVPVKTVRVHTQHHHNHKAAHHHEGNSITSNSDQDSSSSSSSSDNHSGVHVKHVKRINHSDEKRSHSHQKKIEVPKVEFNRLKYVDDTLGESYKAPHTIVTVPLVHTVEEEIHRVAINENIGTSNCPQCVKDEKRGDRIQKKGEKQLVQYDENLKVKIEAPIAKTEVKAEKVEAASHRETNYDKYDHLNRHDYVLLKKNVRIHRADHDSYTESCSSEDGQHHHKGAKRVIINPRSTILTVGGAARRVVAETVVVSHGVDPRGEKTLHEDEGVSGEHRHHYSDNIDRVNLPGQLARGELRQNTPLSVGILNIKTSKVEKVEHDSDDSNHDNCNDCNDSHKSHKSHHSHH